ncbi:MAG TPA: aconitate hydratase [Myxococcales bacterium]|nr:aconitate hydratase [Myxococcales bacterium]HIL00939.1 aconitate hydratase [Myxococcales bacterium]
MPVIETTAELVENTYAKMKRRLEIVRGRLGRPLTYAEKVLFGHLDEPAGQELDPGEAYLLLRPDRIAMQDATAQMALLQFMQAGKSETAVPTTVHCDHLIEAYKGSVADLGAANTTNSEVYDFLRSCSSRYGIGFWGPGAGIIHQVVLEKYAFPGGMMLGTDSHTPNAGGLGMFACGVGGADAVDVMAGFPWEVLHPNRVGVRLTGELGGWTSPKDVILRVLDELTVKGGTNRVVEYFGPGAESISCTGKGTITNMGAELGATTSIFPYDDRMHGYLEATERSQIAALAAAESELLRADAEVLADPAQFFDVLVEIDLSSLEPYIVGPHTPDLAHPVSRMAADARENGYPVNLTAGLIGSCTNSSYEDMSRAADVARQAAERGVRSQATLWVTPGSEQIHQTIARDGQMQDLEAIGATVLANACGPCIGQWKRDDIQKGDANSIISSYNRNFPKRNDGNPETLSFISSPEVVIAYALAGTLDWNPLDGELEAKDGSRFTLSPPAPAPEIPDKGFVISYEGYQAPDDGEHHQVVAISPESKRLQVLTPFPAWDGEDMERLPVLLKARGKCTTDHISMAGPWLRFRGHLDNISDNMFIGAINAFTGDAGTGLDQLSGDRGVGFPAVARHYKAEGRRWVAVGDENYGEGSSREHAAMCPRHLGAAAVITRSFARIHESNLKKQGVLPLTFADPADYEKVLETDCISVRGLTSFEPDVPLTAVLHHDNGSEESFPVEHTLNEEQIAWFKAGSALNLLREQSA